MSTTGTARRWPWRACLVLGSLLGLGMVALAALVAYFYFFGNMSRQPASEPQLLPGPVVTILEPASGSKFAQGNSIQFAASASDAEGVVSLELWIDDTLILSQASPDASGLSLLSLSYPLVAVETGTHTLLAQAFNSKGEFGQSLLHYVTVHEQNASTQESALYTVQEGDTPESIAAKLGVSVDSILAANPNISDGQLQPGQTIRVLMPPGPPAQAVAAAPGGGQQQGGQQQGSQQPGGQPQGNQQQGGQQQGNQQQGGQQQGNQQPGAVPGNLPGILPQFLPGGGPFGQLDPKLLPDPRNVIPDFPLADVTAPGSLSAVADHDACKVTLTWNDSANETGYRIDRYTFGKPDPTTVAGTVGPDSTSYVDTVPAPAKYGYRVSAQQVVGGKTMPQAPSGLVWVDVLSSQACEPLAEYKRVIFQPITFTPKDAGLTSGHLRISIGGATAGNVSLPAIRIPRADQSNLPTGDWSAVPGISAPAPMTVYTNPGASIPVEVHGDGTSDPVSVPPAPLGQFLNYHAAADLTAPDAPNNLYRGEGAGFTLVYKLWVEDWLWDGKPSNPSLPPPFNLNMYEPADKPGERWLAWSYDQDIMDKEVDGFVVYRQYICSGDSANLYPLVAEKPGPAGTPTIVLSKEDEPTDCGCNFQVSAFGPSGESERSAPQKQECRTKPPVERVYVEFDSLEIYPAILVEPTTAEIYLSANALSLRSYAVALEAKSYELAKVPFRAMDGKPGLYIPIGANESSSIALNFSVTDVCRGEELLLRKEEGPTGWGNLGERTIVSRSEGATMCELRLRVYTDTANAPTPAWVGAGDACTKSDECLSGICSSGICAPSYKGAANQFCFANSHCASGVCECFADGQSIPCSPVVEPDRTGFCAAGKTNGALCSKGEECASGYCANGACAPPNGLGRYKDYCHHNDHCASGYCLCQNGWDAFGFCRPDADGYHDWGYCAPLGVWTHGSTCEKDGDCASGNCAQNKCAPRKDTGLVGEYCHRDDQCYSGTCDCLKERGGGLCVDYQDFTPQIHATCAP